MRQVDVRCRWQPQSCLFQQDLPQTLSTVPNQGCCSQVSGQNADNVTVGRQLLDRINPLELQSFFSELSGRLNVSKARTVQFGKIERVSTGAERACLC